MSDHLEPNDLDEILMEQVYDLIEKVREFHPKMAGVLVITPALFRAITTNLESYRGAVEFIQQILGHGLINYVAVSDALRSIANSDLNPEDARTFVSEHTDIWS